MSKLRFDATEFKPSNHAKPSSTAGLNSSAPQWKPPPPPPAQIHPPVYFAPPYPEPNPYYGYCDQSYAFPPPQYGYGGHGGYPHQYVHSYQDPSYDVGKGAPTSYQQQKQSNEVLPINLVTDTNAMPEVSTPAPITAVPAEEAAEPTTIDAQSDDVESPDDSTSAVATGVEVVNEKDWCRGAVLAEDSGRASAASDVLPEEGSLGSVANPPASPWKRGSTMAEKTAAHMLARDDGIVRYSKANLFTMNSKGKLCPAEVLGMYGDYAKKERMPASENRTVPKSPAYKSRRTRRQEELDEPHPDEQIIFSKENLTKEGTFRYDPNKAVDDSEATVMNAKLILNKLTPDNFDRLSVQFMEIGMETEEMMSRVVDMIVSKAQLEEPFCFMYADLCKKITDQWAVPGEDGESVLGKSFRNVLLSRCQEEFQQDREAAVQTILDMDLPDDDREEKLLILKQRYTGHMRFVGEIYMKDMIKANKIHICITDLLNSGEEEKLLCLCKLMQTVGKKLEEYELKKKRTTVAAYFDTIGQISRDKKKTSSKIRFLFQDLIEMRRNNWTARRVEEKAKKQSAFRAAVDSPSGGAPPGAKFAASGINPPRGFAAPKASGCQDARAAPAAPAGEDDWSVASRKKGGRGGGSSRPAVAPTPQGRGGFGELHGSTVGNKFSLLGNAGSESAATASRKGGKKSLPMLQTSTPELDRGSRKSAAKLHRDDSGYSSGDCSPTASPLKRNESDLSRSYSSAVGEDGSLDSHSVSRVVAAMNEYFLNGMLDEAGEVMRELVHPNAMHEALRACIQAILEKKTEDRVKFNTFLRGLYVSGLLSGQQAILGLSKFLDTYDDIVIDVPRVGDYTADIIANLYVAGALEDLSFMLSLPDENNFSLSMGQFDLIVKSASVVATLKDETTAKELVTATLKAKGSLDDMQQEQLSSAVEKCSAQYLL